MEYGEFVIGFILLASGFLLMLLFVPPVVYAFDLFVAMFTKRPPNSLIEILVILVLLSQDSKVNIGCQGMSSSLRGQFKALLY